MKRLALLLPLLTLATAGCFQEETIFVPFVDPATNAPAAKEIHAESAESAENEPHAENAESAE